jgi:hypothetical protein
MEQQPMVTMRVFDPAMCCSTGVCGPSVDPALARFAADLEWLRGQGVTVERFNLAQAPAAFTATQVVKDALAQSGTSCLPLILVDGGIVSAGRYPAREELAQAVRAQSASVLHVVQAPACCTPAPGSSKCC